MLFDVKCIGYNLISQVTSQFEEHMVSLAIESVPLSPYFSAVWKKAEEHGGMLDQVGRNKCIHINHYVMAG